MNEHGKIITMLAAIRVFEQEAEPKYVVFSLEALGMTVADRDNAAIYLEEREYIEGMKRKYKDSRYYYNWRCSCPKITLKGYEYIATDEALRKEIQKIHVKAALEARAKIANVIEEFAED